MGYNFFFSGKKIIFEEKNKMIFLMSSFNFKPSAFIVSLCCLCVTLQAQLPQVYDLRIQNLVSPVKDQGTCGACWAFAVTASIESSWLKKGYGLYNISEDNIIDCHGFDESACQGGSFYMANALFTRHKGPLLSSADPYTPTLQNCPFSQPFPPQPPAFVEEIRFLPKNTDSVKQALYNNGALATSMFFNMSVYNAATYKYYDNVLDANDSLYPHCVTLAGWNDTMTFTGAPGPGGWIIKDSYGTSWAQNGYFYVSYYDAGILSETVFFPSRQEVPVAPVNAYVYGHDDFGWVDQHGFGASTAYAMAKYSLLPWGGTPSGQQIKRICTYAVCDGMNITIQVYKNFAGGVLSDLIATTSKTCTYKGFYTFSLVLPTDTIGTTFYIKATYNKPASTLPLIPVEKYEQYHTSGITLSSNSSYISADGINWLLTGQGTSFSFDVCIKMFTEDAPDACILCNTDSLCQGQMVLLSDITPQPKDSVQWYLNNLYQGNLPMCNVLLSNTGMQAIEMVAYYGANSDTAVKIITVNPLPAIPVITQLHDTLFASNALFYQWYNDNGLIPGATTGYYVPNVTGNYYVHTFNMYQCEASSAPYYYTLTGQKHNGEDLTFRIYPNPAKETCRIETSMGIDELWLKDMFGRNIATYTTVNTGLFELNLSGLPAGVYYVKVIAADRVLGRKLFVR